LVMNLGLLYKVWCDIEILKTGMNGK
jgi:hypothetical protein